MHLCSCTTAWWYLTLKIEASCHIINIRTRLSCVKLKRSFTFTPTEAFPSRSWWIPGYYPNYVIASCHALFNSTLINACIIRNEQRGETAIGELPPTILCKLLPNQTIDSGRRGSFTVYLRRIQRPQKPWELQDVSLKYDISFDSAHIRTNRSGKTSSNT